MIWPDPVEMDGITDAAEWSLEQCYHLVLSEWLPAVTPMVLPEMVDGDAVLPPNPDALVSAEALATWDGLVEQWVTPARLMMWCWNYVTTVWHNGSASTVFPAPTVTADAQPAPFADEEFDAWLEQRVRDHRPPDTLTGRQYVPLKRQPDLVADMVARAWRTDPAQVKLTATLVWDQVASKERLTRFLGGEVGTPGTGNALTDSIPGRVRDLLVGSTRTSARTALPMPELRAEMGNLLRRVYSLSEMSFHRATDQTRRGPLYPVETRAEYLRRVAENPMVEPDAPTRLGAEFMQKFRDVARESGLEAAGIINQGMLAAVGSDPDLDIDLVWCSRIDSHTRRTHFVADGQRVPFGTKFRVGGHELAYPGDPDAPAALRRHCRCRVGMVDANAPMPAERRRTEAQLLEIRHRTAVGQVRAWDDPDGLGYVLSSDMKDTSHLTLPDVTAAAVSSERIDTMTDFRTFTDAPLAFVGIPTSDGRMLAKDIELSVRNPPLPLMWMKQFTDGHDAAFTVGAIESARLEGDTVYGSGYLLNTPEADEAANELGHKITRPSVDLASVSWEMTDVNGNPVTEDMLDAMPPDSSIELYMTMTKAELAGATLVSIPAFGDTSLEITGREFRDAGLVASAAEEFRPRIYDHTLFENPNLTEPTLPAMDPGTGRIFGHLACFGECHRSIQSECVIAPRSRSNYAHFHTSPAVRLDNGDFLPVGRLTVGTGHAPAGVSGRVAAAHYDNTGACFALVRVGEDAHGIWFSGVAAPWATAEQVEMGLSSPLSGDWRDFGSGLELVAALSVNTPGFPVAKGRSDERGRPVALVAALGPVPEDAPARIDRETLRAVARAVLSEQRAEDEERTLATEREAVLARAYEVTRPPTPDEEIEELLAKIRG